MVVTLLSTTPVKGLRVHHPQEILLGPAGAAGDRDFFLIDEDGKLVSIPKVGPLVQLSASYDPESGRLRVDGSGEPPREATVELGDPVEVDHLDNHIRAHRVTGPWDALFKRVTGRRLQLAKAD